MRNRERLSQLKPGRGDLVLMHVRDEPRGRHLFVQVPEDTLKPMLKDPRTLGGPQNPVRFCVTVESASEETIKPRHVVHVQVRKQQVINPEDIGQRYFGETTLAAVEQQPLESLAAVDLNQESVIFAGCSQNTESDAH